MATTTLTVTAETGTVYTARAYATPSGRAMVEIIGGQREPRPSFVGGLLEQPHPHRGMLDNAGALIDGPAIDKIRDWLFDLPLDTLRGRIFGSDFDCCAAPVQA
jgi:hypothetical protein